MSDSNSTITGAATTEQTTITGSAGGSDSMAGASGTSSVSGASPIPLAQGSALTKVPPAPPTPVAPAVTTIQDPPVPAAPVLTSQQRNDARQLSIITELLTGFKTRLNVRIGNDANFQVAATDLSNVISRIVINPTKESVDYVWSFFVENANGVCQETMALKGVEALAPNVRSLTELVYTLLRKATKGIDVSNPALVNQNTVKTIVKSPRLIAQLAAKSKTVVVPAKT